MQTPACCDFTGPWQGEDKRYAKLHYNASESFQIDGSAQEHESLHLIGSKSLCGQWGTEDDGRNAREFFCFMQHIVECQAISVGEMILQEKQVGLDVFDEVQRCPQHWSPVSHIDEA